VKYRLIGFAFVFVIGVSGCLPVPAIQTPTSRMRMKQKALMELAKRDGVHVLGRSGYVLVQQPTVGNIGTQGPTGMGY